MTIAEKLPLRTEWIMVKAKDGTDSVESFEMEVAEEEEESDDDDDDEVFVKKGGRHGNENGSAKKPLIKGNLNRFFEREKETKFWRFLERVFPLPGNKARNGKRNGALHTEIREGGSLSINKHLRHDDHDLSEQLQDTKTMQWC